MVVHAHGKILETRVYTPGASFRAQPDGFRANSDCRMVSAGLKQVAAVGLSIDCTVPLTKPPAYDTN
jgi:hypothetical protein